jgi:hypothetical protein
MKHRISITLSIVACSLLFLPVAKAGVYDELDQFVSAISETIRKDRIILISDSLRFTPEEAAAFWAVYEKYVEEMTAVQESRVKLVKDYLTDISFQITEDTAQELTQRSFHIIGSRLKIRQKYYPLFTKATSASLATRFMQLDRMIDTAIDLRIAMAMPAYPTEMGDFLKNSNDSPKEEEGL